MNGNTANGGLPLDGMRILDFSQLILGPAASQTLGDYGADVIKIERPVEGDLNRIAFPYDPAGPDHPIYCCFNRNKRSIVIDLRSEKGREIVLKMVETADVVIHNFRAGVMERMGFGYDVLSRVNPRIILASGTGFGPVGPYAHKGGQDALAQAISGAMLRRPDPSQPIAIYSTTIADYTAAMHLLQAILLALLHRERTGKGQVVHVSLYDSMLAMQSPEAAMVLMRGREFNFAGLPVRGVFKTTDGNIVMVGGWDPNALRKVSAALEIADLSKEERFSSLELQLANRPALQEIFREHFAHHSTAHWLEVLDRHNILCAPVRSLAETLEDEQTAINGMVWRKQGVKESIAVVGSPIHMSNAAASMRQPPPTLGQDGRTILSEFGFEMKDVDELVAAGVVA